MKTKTHLRIKSLQYHKWLVWLALAGLLVFGLSGLLHPLMIWTGPKPAAFYPPKAMMQAQQAAAIPRVLAQHGIASPLQVKLIPSGDDVLVQVTESTDAPRRYFDPETGNELEGHDMRHAVILARYYSGLETADVASVTFQTTFDNAYPWVNRLLPVYRITFDTPDRRTVFVHTELNALANLTNDWKTTLQTLFGVLHTWNFLDDAEPLRVAAMLLLLTSLFAMAVVGAVLLLTLKRRSHASSSRRWHRRLAMVLWLPFLAFTATGSYHLLQYSSSETVRGMRFAVPLPVNTGVLEQRGAWMGRYADVPLHALSLVMGEGGALFYRLGVAQNKAMPTDTQRFNGIPMEREAIYVNARDGKEMPLTDALMARFAAGFYSGGETPEAIEKITRFSPEYDFRNKRLPAWRVGYASGQVLFVDPAANMLIDRVSRAERAENYVFSHGHKWNFVADATNRPIRDALVVATLMCMLLMGILGIILKKRMKK